MQLQTIGELSILSRVKTFAVTIISPQTSIIYTPSLLFKPVSNKYDLGRCSKTIVNFQKSRGPKKWGMPASFTVFFKKCRFWNALWYEWNAWWYEWNAWWYEWNAWWYEWNAWWYEWNAWWYEWNAWWYE